MPHRPHDPPDVAAPSGGYSHGLAVDPGARYLFISGQIPTRPDGSVPDTFAEQCDAAWGNVVAVLRAAGMTVADLVKVTTYLTDRDQVAENRAVRQRHLGAARPALTVVIAQTLDPAWLLEIEAIAATTA